MHFGDSLKDYHAILTAITPLKYVGQMPHWVRLLDINTPHRMSYLSA